MSAAAPPTPPPHRPPIRSVAAPATEPARARTPNGPSGGPQQRPLWLLQDIISRAEAAADPHSTLSRLLQQADNSLKSSRAYLDSDRYDNLDRALLEFSTAANIVSNIIPRHKDAPALKVGHNKLGILYGQCIKAINAAQANFDQVSEIVKADNQRSAVQPSAAAPDPAARDVSSPPPPPPQTSRPHSVQVSSVPNGTIAPTNRHSIAIPPSQSPAPAPPQFKRSPPPIRPKPKTLHGHVITSNGQHALPHPSSPPPPPPPAEDDLTERFARLRSGSRKQPSTISEPPNRSSTHSSISVNPSLSNHLPKHPSPTYSPVRSSQAESAAHTSQSPRSTVLSLDNSTSSLSSIASLPFSGYQNGYESGHSAPPAPPAHAPGPNEPGNVPRRRPQSDQMPQETQITADRLFDYMRAYNVLLIDVRSREQYDYGHIFSKSVICVEPAGLRPGMSAEELVDSLCISPDAEPELFERRDQFDLVVYYDQMTATTDYLQGKPGSNVSLKYLHDALFDFNQEKPLHWPPILLVGGLNAWIDLLGQNALQMSNTAPSRTAAAKSGRPIARRPAVTNSAKINVLKRYREYNPLAPEEEQKWRERARSESIVLQSRPEVDEDDEVPGAAEEPLQTPNSYDDFQARYPDVEAVERMGSTPRPPSRPVPEVPQVPYYPEPPVPSHPSRPPPAVPRPSFSGVSERAPSQTSISTKSSQLAPYIPPKLMQLPRTGLHNFGVTCYMNATIQCLSATIPLTAFFFEGRFKRFIQQGNWKGSKGLMPELYYTLLQHLWRPNDADTIRPTNFRKFCARLNREWGIDRQQDAKEFLEFLVDTLHEDFNTNWARNPLRALTVEQEAAREKTPPFYASKMEWDRYTHRDLSQMTELFAGQHISRLQCTTCHHSSTTYEAFYSISVEIPTPAKGRQVDIHDCLRSYCSAERLSKEDYWRCPNCKTHREATKRITITRAPQFLVIHFKRFSASHAERARKVHTPVSFPLTGLDMSAYTLPPPDAATQDYMAKAYGPDSIEAPYCMTPPYKYDAYAVMRHIGGTMTSGHYTALVEVKARGCWREFNDDRVTDFRPESLAPSKSLQNEQAYIVFYQRVP